MTMHCRMDIWVREADVERFEALGFHSGDNDRDVGFNLYRDSLIDEDELPRDIPWHGEHEAGTEWGSYVFACDGREFVSVPGDQEGYPVVRLHRDGEIRQQDRDEAARYWRLYEGAIAAMEPGQVEA